MLARAGRWRKHWLGGIRPGLCSKSIRIVWEVYLHVSCLCFEFMFSFSIFSDFDGPMVPSVPLPPPPPFPVPPYPLSQLDRNQLIPYARCVLKHIGPIGLDIGYGNSKAWTERVPVAALSQRTQKLLGPGIDTVAMGDFR